MLPVELWEHSCCFSLLPVDRKYQMGQSRGTYTYIILSFNSKYTHQWIKLIYLQDKQIINIVS